MKNILKKLHIVPGQAAEEADRSPPSRGSAAGEQKPFANLSNWLNSVASKHALSSASTPSAPSSGSSSTSREERRDCDGRKDSGSGAEERSVMDPEMDEEYQIQLALELSGREDPEAVQIEAVKQISLGSFPPENTPAEILAYRYWNYNAFSYDDKILDGFYDLYGVLTESSLVKMPSLVDIQRTAVSDDVSWEVVLVNKATDTELLKLEQKAIVMALESKPEALSLGSSDLVRRLTLLVSDHMGGAVRNPDSMLRSWRKLSNYLRASSGNMVLPLGHLTIGLARHRALLFKVLADSVGIPCQLLKGQQYTGSEDGALNIVKFSNGREFIVDLVVDPGTLIPSDGAGPSEDFEETFSLVNPCSSSSSFSSSMGCSSEIEPFGKKPMSGSLNASDSGGVGFSELKSIEGQVPSRESSGEILSHQSDEVSVAPEPSFRSDQPYALARSPSWTEGISSPAVHRMKVKDVSQYMIEATKENPQLAQKLHDVLLESGVVAPPNLFTGIYTEHPDSGVVSVSISDDRGELKKKNNEVRNKTQFENSLGTFLPPLPIQNLQRKGVLSRLPLEPLKPIEGLGLHPPDSGEADGVPCLPRFEATAVQLQETPLHLIRNMPVAAAAATAAVVASSMVVAAAKSSSDINMEVPVAAAVVATTAAVSRQYEHPDNSTSSQSASSSCQNSNIPLKNENDAVANTQVRISSLQDGGLVQEHQSSPTHQETERVSDRSTGNGSTKSAKSDIALDDVAEYEILWEDIVLGERIGLGSFGEVYHGEWHETEVAVKKFLQQDISGDALDEFISEVHIMKRLRHPNVVLFMGAVTRVPNLSIVTEFLHRGSLFRLIHRPDNQLDERRRLRMALDVARGMNYLHNCTPVIVHHDLKSPNLLVDKHWVVKVCDFGLSHMKHSTFLSSRSTAGTAEWMAPEVLRNEPSDEKCDVFSFGVILWELCTLQQPWGGLNPMQVVGAVGFQHRRLDIPDDMDPVIADIIRKCWQIRPKDAAFLFRDHGSFEATAEVYVWHPNTEAKSRHSSKLRERSVIGCQWTPCWQYCKIKVCKPLCCILVLEVAILPCKLPSMSGPLEKRKNSLSGLLLFPCPTMCSVNFVRRHSLFFSKLVCCDINKKW